MSRCEMNNEQWKTIYLLKAETLIINLIIFCLSDSSAYTTS